MTWCAFWSQAWISVGQKQVESVDTKDIKIIKPGGKPSIGDPRRPSATLGDLEASSFSVSHASVAPPLRGVRCASLGRPNGLGVLSTRADGVPRRRSGKKNEL